MDFYIAVFVNQLSSITASFNGYNVPVDYFYIENNPMDYDYSVFVCRVDIRGLDKTQTQVPQLLISGFSAGTAENSRFVELRRTVGSIEVSQGNLLQYYFRDLGIDINNGLIDLGYSIARYLDDLKVSLWNIQTDTKTFLTDKFKGVTDKLEDFRTDMRLHFSSLTTYLTGKFKEVTDRLDNLIGDSDAGAELKEDSAQISEGVASIGDSVGSQQVVLDNNFDAITSAVSFVSFLAPLAFVQKYLNLAVAGISDKSTETLS